MTIPTTAGCRFEYTKQPPSTIRDDCSPYGGSRDIIRIALECDVKKQKGITDEFDIRWFRKNTTGAVEDLGTGDPVTGTSSRYCK